MEFEGLLLEVFPDVYEPAEDSFLLARHAGRIVEGMRKKGLETGKVSGSPYGETVREPETFGNRERKTGNQKPRGRGWRPKTGNQKRSDCQRTAPRILDMGCGCGIISLACAKANPESIILGVDKNPNAVENAENNAKRNGIKNTGFAQSDLFSNVKGTFDAIIFNPPYLPTAEREKLRGNLNLAFDGGRSGREVTDRFLAQFPKFLKKGGTLLMVESSLAGIEKTIAKLEKMGFGAKVVEEERFFFEKIVVIEAGEL